ncbi:MAG: hypothetical protein Kow0069_23260 [Promethearchaeota archaeon]
MLPRSKRKRMAFLLHPTRRVIYKVICENPGAYFYNLAADLSKEQISSGTLSYHLRKLEDSGLISSVKMEGKRVYLPRMLREPDIEKVFLLLRNKRARSVFLYIVNHEGCYQNEIAREIDSHHDTVRYHVEKLEAAGLIVRRKGKKNVRFFIGPRGEELLTGSLNLVTQQYVDFLRLKLQSECGGHIIQVVEQSKRNVVIRISCPGEDDITFSLELRDWQVSEDESDSEP